MVLPSARKCGNAPQHHEPINVRQRAEVIHSTGAGTSTGADTGAGTDTGAGASTGTGVIGQPTPGSKGGGDYCRLNSSTRVSDEWWVGPHHYDIPSLIDICNTLYSISYCITRCPCRN